MRLTSPLPVLLAAGFSLSIAGCGRDRGGAADGPSNFRGVVMEPPIEKPDFVLTDFNREAFNFRLATAGKVTLLFFGYTHCPDVCPVHAANIAAVLRQMPFAERDSVRFVFVTTDPDRDTPERLREWLGSFDRSFVGLTGPIEQVNELQAQLRLPGAARDSTATDTAGYLVGHAAQVLAFGKDGLARLEYPFGIRQEDWANDLPRLVRGEAPPESRAGAGAEGGAVAAGPAVGQAIPLTLRFAKAGELVFTATVVGYADLEKYTAPVRP